MDNINYKRDKVEVPRSGDLVGIRATLNNMGISNKNIGFNEASGNVTLNGREFMKPTVYDDVAGITYSSEADIRNNLTDFYRGSSNPIVRVSDEYASAAGKYGLGADALTYGNGVVSIGGSPLNTLYIDDSGKAWAWQDDVRNAVTGYANRVGVENPNSLYDRYAREYLSDINSRISELNNRKEFSYNPDNDPVYLAYKKKYLTEGNRATRNAIANYSALTGGYANSAAATAGALAGQYYAQQLTDKIPELAQQAYSRYSDRYQTDIDLVGKMIDMYNKAYGNASAANKAALDNANYAAASVVQRDKDAYEKELSAYDRYWDEKFNRQKYDSGEQGYRWTELLNQQKQLENSYKNQGYAYDVEKKQLDNEQSKLGIEQSKLGIEQSKLDNEKSRIYLEYYKRLLEADISSKNAAAIKARAEARARYGA